jgi:hypothetical protein
MNRLSVVGVSSKRSSLPLTQARTWQGPLASRELPRFNTTMSPADSRPEPCERLCLPSRRWAPRPLGRVSQVPGGSFHARRPQPPRGVRQVHLPIATLSIAGFANSGRLATPDWRNEAEAGSLYCGSRVRLARLRTPDRSDARSLGYLSNGQFTR